MRMLRGMSSGMTWRTTGEMIYLGVVGDVLLNFERLERYYLISG